MTRSNSIDATAWRNVIEFERLTTIYLGFFSEAQLKPYTEVSKHRDEHRISQEEGVRLADLKKSHDEWIESYMENIKNKQN